MLPDPQDDTIDITFGLADFRVSKQVAYGLVVGVATLAVVSGAKLASCIKRCVAGVAIRGRLVRTNEVPVEGAAVHLLTGGNLQQSCQTSASGEYAFVGLQRGHNQTVRVELKDHTLEPAERNLAALNADATVDFTARPFPRITGRVTAASRCTAVQRVRLQLWKADGVMAHEVETGRNGEYEFPAVAPGQDYTLQPSKDSVGFDPATARIESLEKDVVHDFAAQISVSGRINSLANGAANGTELQLQIGLVNRTTLVDSNGNFLFEAIPAGVACTVTPTKPFHEFRPANRIFNSLVSNRQHQNFTVTRSRHSFTATVVAADGGMTDAIEVRVLKGAQEVIAWRTPSTSEAFPLGMLDAGFDYVLETRARYHDLDPDRVTVDALGNDTKRELRATRRLIPVEVQVRDQDGQPVADAQLTLEPEDGAALSHNGADHTFQAPAGFEYRLSVQSATHAFDTASFALARLEAQQHCLFIGVRLYSARGTVRTATGAAIPGAKLRISGSLVRELTGLNNGRFLEPQLRHGGTYTLTPEARHYTFVPANAVLNALNANSVDHDFVGTLNQYSICGRVTDVANNAVPGWNVTLAEGANQLEVVGPPPALSYAFNNRNAGREYTLTPALAGHDFDPPQRRFHDFGQDELAVHFRAIPHPTVDEWKITLSGNRSVVLCLESWQNYMGHRGIEHRIPVNELVVASEWAFNRHADEKQGSNHAYFLPYPSGRWLTLVLIPTNDPNKKILLTNYHITSSQAQDKLANTDTLFNTLMQARRHVLQYY